MAEKTEKNREVKICPKCMSDNISSETSVSDAHDCCVDCGFNSTRNGVVVMQNFPTKTKIITEKKK